MLATVENFHHSL